MDVDCTGDVMDNDVTGNKTRLLKKNTGFKRLRKHVESESVGEANGNSIFEDESPSRYHL